MVFSVRSLGACLVHALSLAVIGVVVVKAAAVRVVDVSFDRIVPRGGEGEWLEVAIEVEGARVPGATRPLTVGLDLALEREESEAARHAFYRAEAVILLPEEGADATVYFYLPPALVERYELRGEPFGWRVRLAQEGRVWPQLRGTYSDSLADPEAARSFAQRVTEAAEANGGWLQPIYLTPFYEAENGRLFASPSYLRRERVGPGTLP